MNISPCNNINNTKSYTRNSKPAFRGGMDKISEGLAKTYGKKYINAKWSRDLAKWLQEHGGGEKATQHLQTAGSIITSGVYMQQTLTNDKLEKDNRRTLAVNQGLVLGVSTAGAYTLSDLVAGGNKKTEYAFVSSRESNIKEKARNLKLPKQEIEKLRSDFTKELGGFRTLLPIVTFTLIYRFVSPVAITPLANWIGKKINAKKANEEISKQDESQKQAEIVELKNDGLELEKARA